MRPKELTELKNWGKIQSAEIEMSGYKEIYGRGTIMPKTTRYFMLNDEYYKDESYGILLYTPEAKHFELYIRNDAESKDYHFSPFLLIARSQGKTSLSQDWLMRWISERLVPPNQVNIYQILAEAGLKTYDEFGLLMFYHGRCCQDNNYLTEITAEDYEYYKNKWHLA